MLPTELLVEIFTRVSSSPVDLYHVLASSRRFASIVRPILYRHVTITSSQQRRRLRSVRQEDAQLVKQVTILGDGPIEPEDIDYHVEQGYCPLDSDCVYDLLTGKILDISVVEILHVRNVHELTDSLSSSLTTHFPFRVASNLSQLSIWGHQGASPLWKSFLCHSNLPSLRQLGFADVTLYGFEEPELECDCYDCYEAYLKATPWPVEYKTTLVARAPFSQVEVLVAEWSSTYSEIPDFPLDNFFAVEPLSPVVLASPQIVRVLIDPGARIGLGDALRRLGVEASTSTQSRPNSPTIQLFVRAFSDRRPDDRVYSATHRSTSKGFSFHELEEEHEEEREEEGDPTFVSLLNPTLVTHLQQRGKSSSQI
ncbi:hypothetical protein JCM11491_007202 [Sporobolomyces phaffii]